MTEDANPRWEEYRDGNAVDSNLHRVGVYPSTERYELAVERVERECDVDAPTDVEREQWSIEEYTEWFDVVGVGHLSVEEIVQEPSLSTVVVSSD